MAAKGKRASKAAEPAAAERILEATLALAEVQGWEEVRLRQVAEQLELPSSEVLAHYRDLDAVADAWFGKALEAMLATPPEELADLAPRERLHHLLMRWFDRLVVYRRVTGEMLSTKLYLSHPHHWVPMIFNLSRTIQWLRDCAGLDAGGLRRQVEEVGLTSLFLATLAVWVRDDSEGQARTRAFLARGLGLADEVLGRFDRAPLRRRRRQA